MNKGSVTILVLLVATLSVIILGSLVAVTAVHVKGWVRQENRQMATNIAEAGVNYYRWHLAHAPEDFQDGTGESGPYIHDYFDPQGDQIGQFELDVIPPEEGSSVVTIVSTGWTLEEPKAKRTIEVAYGQPSYARFSFLHNANVWFGQGLTTYGDVHSNGGIRMDGINESVVSSVKETYTCGSETGCSPSETKNGVWGDGPNNTLWEYPSASIDFDSVVVDFAQMRLAAQESGIHLTASSDFGYHLHFNAAGTVSVYEVRRTRSRQGWDPEGGCQTLNQVIRTENLIGTYNLSDNKIIFVEDTVWVDGVVNGKTTVVAASFPIDTSSEVIWILDNLTYKEKDGSDSLGLVAQQDIYYALDIPSTFQIDAALMAQKGRIIRHFYSYWWVCSNYSNAIRDKLEIYGAVISNQKSYWNYGNPIWSGFVSRDITYDTHLRYGPPPYFPTSSEYEFIKWDEE